MTTMIQTFELLKNIKQKATIETLSEASGWTYKEVAKSLSLNLANITIDNSATDAVYALKQSDTQIQNLRNQNKLIYRGYRTVTVSGVDKYLALALIDGAGAGSGNEYTLRQAVDQANTNLANADKIGYGNTMTSMQFYLSNNVGDTQATAPVNPTMFNVVMGILRPRGYVWIDDVTVGETDWISLPY